MIASADSSDRGTADASFDYDEFVSVLMYYGHMSKNEIMHSSRKFLYAIYQNYVKRACENLGVSSEPDDENDMGDSEYPTEFRAFTKEESQQYAEELSDEEYFAQFPEMQH